MSNTPIKDTKRLFYLINKALTEAKTSNEINRNLIIHQTQSLLEEVCDMVITLQRKVK